MYKRDALSDSTFTAYLVLDVDLLCRNALAVQQYLQIDRVPQADEQVKVRCNSPVLFALHLLPSETTSPTVMIKLLQGFAHLYAES